MEEKTKKGGTVKLVLIVALIAAIVSGGAVYFFLNKKDDDNNKSSETTNTTTNETTNTATNNNVAENNETDGNNTSGGSFLNGLFGKKDDEGNNTVNNTTGNTTTPNTNNNSTTSTNVKESSKENPLSLGEWGKASKFVSEHLAEVYKDVDYTDVPVSVTKITRGSEAEKIVKEWFNNQKYYKYEDPKTNMEWAVVDYKVDLTGLKFDEKTIGTDIDIYSHVTGTNGGGIKYNDVSYIVSTKDISSSERVKTPGVYEGRFIVTLPTGCSDYIIELGNSYNGAISYFKGQ